MPEYFEKMLGDVGACHAILGGMCDAISIQDPDLKVLYQNDAHKRLLGGHAGDYCYQGFHKRDKVCEGCPVIMTFKDGNAHTTVKSGNADGGVIFAEITASPIKDAAGRIVASLEVTRNITDRVEEERELKETKQMLEDVTQGINEGIMLLTKDYKVLWANNAAARQSRLPADKLVGNYCYDATHGLKHPCAPPANACPVSELLKTGKPVTAVHEHHDKRGNTVYAEVRAYPIKDHSGEIVRFVHIAKDITALKSIEQGREKLVHELQDVLGKTKTLTGLILICSSCRHIRNDHGYWVQLESYLLNHTDVELSHGICPQCVKKLYPELNKE